MYVMKVSTHSHGNKAVLCPLCITAAASDSLSSIEQMLPEIGNEYRKMFERIVSVSETDYAILHLAGSIDINLEYLINNWFKTEVGEFGATLAVYRNVFEKLSSLSYLLSGTEKEKRAYSSLLASSTYDVVVVLSTMNPNADANRWKSQSWADDSTIQSRLKDLGGGHLKLVYGYLSRVNHYYNRDSSLSHLQDEIFISLWLLVEVMNAYCNAMARFSKSIASDTLGNKHSVLHELISRPWKLRNIEPKDLIKLTTFAKPKHNGAFQEFMEKYVEMLSITTRTGELPAPQLVSRIPSK